MQRRLSMSNIYVIFQLVGVAGAGIATVAKAIHDDRKEKAKAEASERDHLKSTANHHQLIEIITKQAQLASTMRALAESDQVKMERLPEAEIKIEGLNSEIQSLLENVSKATADHIRKQAETFEAEAKKRGRSMPLRFCLLRSLNGS